MAKKCGISFNELLVREYNTNNLITRDDCLEMRVGHCHDDTLALMSIVMAVIKMFLRSRWCSAWNNSHGRAQ